MPAFGLRSPNITVVVVEGRLCDEPELGHGDAIPARVNALGLPLRLILRIRRDSDCSRSSAWCCR